VLVATPIGNLGDLAPRAVEVLRDADVIAAEDTRRTRALLTHAGLSASGRLVAVHEHNERGRAAELVDEIRRGGTVALVTDAGMPSVSDPGYRLVALAVERGVDVTVLPGPSAVLAALAVSGLPVDRFCFEGFLPPRGTARRQRLAALAGEEIVFTNAPGLLLAGANVLAVQGLNVSAGDADFLLRPELDALAGMQRR
jgi:16S rRNA (cytidine1402-2'-O)-methyltransferase